MYEHVTRFIDDIERVGFAHASETEFPLTEALYQPEIDKDSGLEV